MKFKKIALLAMAATTAVTLAACVDTNKDNGTYTYSTYTSVSPSNWNELTYQDNNDTQIMSYIGSSFFTFDFKFDSNGEIVDGEFEVEYSAATKLEDVTSTYAGNEKYLVPADATKNYAFKITLRNDLKWDDGTAIKAEDFVYTMQEQLNPEFKNYRADSFYNGGTIIHNAKGYAFQGSTQDVSARDKHAEWNEAAQSDSSLFFTLSSSSTVGAWIASNYGSYLSDHTPAWVLAAADYVTAVDEAAMVALEGKTWAEITADPALKAAWDAVIGFWQTEPNEELDLFSYSYTFPAMEMSEVGIFVGSNDYELVVVLDKPLELLKEDGSLSYKAAYNFSSLPLVHKAKYEANKVEPAEGSTLWTSTYNSDVDTTASWGPYKLTEFQAGKNYVLEKNENWYGYGMKEYEGQYQTTKIVCETIKEYETALLKFKAGEIDGIGIDVSVANDYKNSEQAIYTPDDFVGSLQLQSSKEALKSRESEGVNKTILSYTNFRKALSLSIDRDDYAKKCTTSSKAGFGIFNSMHYYDVANGGVYRNEDVAKKVLCDVYAVDPSKYASLDEAQDAITGYNLEEARKLVTEAYNAALEAGDIAATDKVSLAFGTGAITESTQRQFDYLSAAFVKLVETTPLEGRLECTFEDHGDAWAKDFRNGGYDICTGGWTGAAWDPGYFLLAYLSPDYMYSTAWDTSTATLTFTMPGEGFDGAGVEMEMSLMDWYDCLNGNTGCKYNWSEGAIPVESRLALIAALEKEILSVYYTVPITYSFGASLISYKFDYITREYNTFMGYGGIRYMNYNYNDTKFVADANGEIDYTA